MIKGAVSRDFLAFFLISWIEAIWAPEKQSKMFCLKIRFREDIREKFDSSQANT